MKNEIVKEQEAKELAFQLADRYISIHETSEGYDYTIYDMDYRELDGGIYDNLDISIHKALNDIVLDLKKPIHRSKLEGKIHDYDELIPIDYDDLTAKAEYVETRQLEKYVRKTEDEREAVTNFKTKTEEMLHDINGLTQTDIELNVYAYLQSKIDKYEMAIKLVDLAVSGSRCRGMEKNDSDLDDENQKVISFTVAECSEFHNLGEYHENIACIDKAITIFNQIPPTRMNGIPSIGINIHTIGTEHYEDLEIDILCGNTIDLEFLDFMPDFTGNPQVIDIIENLIAKLPEAKVLGSLEKWKTI